MQYTLVGSEDGSVITVFLPGRKPLTAHSSHPNFTEIEFQVRREDGLADLDFVVSLFDIAQTASDRFEYLTERVTVANGRLYFDGDEINNSLSKQVVRFLNDGVEDWEPLVNFFENVQSNPNSHSREQLYNWLSARDFTITPDGMIVGYKGVESNNGDYYSVYSGKATVDGIVYTGKIPNSLGSVVEMPRSEVHHDPSNGCSVGLHVADFDFASGWGNTVLEVHVNPRDVVSVPTESQTWNKVRVCRYTVVGIVDNPYRSALRSDPLYTSADELDDDDWFDNHCGDCGEGWDDCECSNVTPETPKEFLENTRAGAISVDRAWKEWNEVYPNRSMTRDEFRKAVK